ncbi:hypothetical protein FGO68_gene4052 [Halteria grandinella]|uniref:Poly [ADP-ribose] polymerase n=1 Tax=Halteria grandinella TaxID=5974 RepID=A0A8J8T5H9_HALGN|nr:hypothetical protein FGO68_gene1143 [Halteria grandinella]TNV82113.1 hypothetical protein FGO68_gene4052 [Halteria grandinella]
MPFGQPQPLFAAAAPNYGLINNFGNAFGGVAPVGAGRIIKIEKVYNCVLYEKFMNEFKRMLRKYPNLQVTDMVKHLFHGTRATSPKQIYETEDGLDLRFSNSGMYGQGIYFADNSQYSHSYHHPTKDGQCQMFMALVLVGDSITLPPGQYRIPPNKQGSTTERYDSINNGEGGHYIVYDNVKCYPGYIITYK